MSRPTTARAQSETVGIILLVAVFVVSASAIGVAYVGGVGSDTDEVVVSAELSADGTDLRVDHLGGDALPNGELAVVVRADGNATRYPFAPPAGEFAPGERRAFSDALVANATNEVALYHEASGERIARTTLAPTATPPPAAETGSIEGTVVGPGAAATRVASGASLGLRPSVVPLSGATVAVDGAGRVAEATTGVGGAYRIDGLEPGEYEVSANAPGLAVSATTVEVEPNETATVDFRLDPLRPAEFAVEIAGVDASVDAGDPVTVDATVENVGDERGTETVELRVGDERVDSVELPLDAGESRTVSLRWQTLPTDVGEETLTVDAGDDAATTTVEVLDAATDAVAYVDRDGDGDPDETYTAVELAFLGAVDGHLVVYDDVTVETPVGATADRVTVRDGVAIAAASVALEADKALRVGDGAEIDTDPGGFFFAGAGDVSLRAGGDLDARGATVRTSASAAIAAGAGDIELTAGGDADLRDGTFEAVGVSFFGRNDGRITVTAGGTVRTEGASFDPPRE
ncbi:type IV pilin [Halorubrum sp. Atlit-8R]|uniref:carboxypeptidase regulatory-like domain-containing protein n=1 Tax=unclassified Halorubrum TaxID=2642239 RepID=UPI000EF1BA44|nr:MULTISPECIES: carboxypeptidase regulatory-like domain-containing protein [unclassified Halorubrum]RLM67899.1 type IV pilin [Halorubrum sp. Atlit-9R]RLM81069.1 type IV pilin [Halorubrum sp. Atlit-8R]